MQIVSCPSCGAQVEFKSHAAVVAVCAFCRTTVMKEADAVRDLGTMSAVLEDFTRIQIGTSGVLAGRGFTVVGRLQLAYSAGMWNEWFLLFDDGSNGWLGDSSGLYTVTTALAAPGALPSFEAVHPGRLYDINGERFTAAEKRSATCVGGQGELPFRVGDGWQARVIDLRLGGAFVTLDYSDGERPVLYKGVSVTLESMQCQLLRDDDAIRASAGKYRGRVEALDCPSCGSAIHYLPGVTTSLVCPSCQAQLDAAGPQAQILAKGDAVEQVHTTLALGATATINKLAWRITGAMTRRDDEGASWTEYLLFNSSAGFFWLVQTDDGWSRASVMDTWPQCVLGDDNDAVLDKASYRKLVDYPARVTWAAGAFNWRVAVGDVVRVHEFKREQTTLAAELGDEELTWSRSTPVAVDQVRAWFGASLGDTVRSELARKMAMAPTQKRMAGRFALWILGLNAIPLLFNFSGTIVWVLLAIVAVYWSEQLFDPKGP